MKRGAGAEQKALGRLGMRAGAPETGPRCTLRDFPLYLPAERGIESVTKMRYEKGRKETTRRHILDVASRLFREHGTAATGLAGIMTGAGLTNGAFYAHFESKDDLFRETVMAILDQQFAQLAEATASAEGMEAAIREYLSMHHRNGPGMGCPTSALVSEIARQPNKTRRAYAERLSQILITLAANLPDGDRHARRRDALAMFAMMVGVLQLARAVPDKAQAEQMLTDGIEAALSMVKGRNA
jgi:TetR/AcrR family transcriptional repressor of nem operon